MQKKLNLKLSAPELYWHIQTEKAAVFLDSAMDPKRLGRYSIIAWSPRMTFSAKGHLSELRTEKSTLKAVGNPLTIFEPIYKETLRPISGDLPFYGGWIGYLAYDLGRQLERLPCETVDDIGLADMQLGFYDFAVIFDHLKEESWLVSAHEATDVYDELIHRLEALKAPQIHLEPVKTEPVFDSNFEKQAYLEALTTLRNYIRSGDIYQANLTQRFHTKMQQSPIHAYYKLRQVNPAPFAAFMPLEEGALLSSSPERFISLRKGKLETRPIKGTRPRGETPEADEVLKQALLESEKDQSELLMIVDLERNDLSKVAKVGTVAVPELMVLESYPTVHHLVATVQATLKEGLSAIDVIRHTFPGGSITGAPKIRAMEVIETLEPTQRSVYTGSIGYLCVSGDMDLNIVIRTIIVKGEEAYFQAGGGITWDSVEEDEYEESLQKAKAIKRALSI